MIDPVTAKHHEPGNHTIDLGNPDIGTGQDDRLEMVPHFAGECTTVSHGIAAARAALWISAISDASSGCAEQISTPGFI
jgi:hypothetical protein